MAACACGAGLALPKTIRRDWLEELTQKTKLSASEVKALYARFRRLAPTGFLLPEQFRQTMGVLGLSDDTFLPDRMFQVFNANGDGRLSFHEFAMALAVMIRGTEDEKLKLSFEMAAGQRDAQGLSLQDFQRLIHACNRMMSSLIAPTSSLTSDEDVDRLFHDITGDEGESDGEVVITLESYKAAAQSSEDFLRALGLSWGATRPRGYSRDAAGARNRGRMRTLLPPSATDDAQHISQSSTALSPCRSPAAASTAPAPPEDSVLISARDLEDFRARLNRVEKLMAKKAHLRSQSSQYTLDEPDTQVLTSDDFPEQRPASVPPVDLTAPSMEDAWQDLCKLIDGLSVCGGGAEPGISLFGKWQKGAEGSRDSANGLLGLSPLSADAFAPTHRGHSRDEDRFLSQASRDISRVSSIGSPRGDGGEVLERAVKRTETMQASHRGTRRRRRHRLLGPKKGLAVHFGHESWNMVLSMMIGIRMSVARCKHEMQRELQPVDFIMQEKFTITPRLSSVPYSDERKTMTRFIDFAPLVFQKIRSSFGINEDDYLHSAGPEQLLGNMVLGNLSSLSELSSEGKSGAFFYYTADGNYMMKTVTTKEFEVLRTMLKQYYDHITQNPDTLVVRFLGLHCLRVQSQRSRFRLLPQSKKELYFVVMANMFNTPCEIHRRYDLKGSWVGRVTPSEKRDPHVALKDVDFQQANEKIHIGQERTQHILDQIKRDSEFLASNNIIDYSLLLGIHSKDAVASNASGTEPPESPKKAALQKSEQTTAIHSVDQRSVYFMGIIDILTPYDGMKKFEHRVKAIRYDSRGVSCCPPPFYAERFTRFLEGAFR